MLRSKKDTSYIDRTLALPDDILRVRRFVTATYLKLGAIDEAAVDEKTGAIKDEFDPYYFQSIYFDTEHVRTGNIEVAARLILQTPNEGVNSLQIHWGELDPKLIDKVSTRLGDAHWQNITAEFGSFVKDPEASPIASMRLIRHMVRFTLDEGVKYWVAGVNEGLGRSLVTKFGAHVIPLSDTPVHFSHYEKQYLPYLFDVEGYIGTRHRLSRDGLAQTAIHRFMQAGTGVASLLH